MSKRLSYVGHDSNYLPVEPNTDSQDELLHIRILSILNGNFKSMAADKLLQLITARDAEREAAIRIDEGKYWENNIMPEFRSWQTSEKMSNRCKALEAIKRKE